MKPIFEALDGNIRLRIYHDENPLNPREEFNLGTIVAGQRRHALGDERAQNTELYSSWEEWLEHEILEPNNGEVVYLPVFVYDHGCVTINTTGFSCPWDSGQLGWIYCTKKRFLQEAGYTEKELFDRNPYRKPDVGEHVRIRGRKGWGLVKMLTDSHVTVDFDYNKVLSARRPENMVVVRLTQIVEVMANKAEEILRNEIEEYDDYLTGSVYTYSLEEKVEGEWVEIERQNGLFGSWAKEVIARELRDKQYLVSNFIA